MKSGITLATATLITTCAFTAAPAQAAPASEIWTYWGAGTELTAIEGLMEVSNQHYPDTPIKQRVISGNTTEMRQALQVGFMGGNIPVAWQSALGQELKNFVDSDRLTPIDDIWQQVNGDKIFPEGLARVVTFNGKHYGIPLNMHTVSNVFYNKQIFDKLKLAPPKNWEEFAAVSKVLQDAGYEALANASGNNWTTYNLYAPLISTLGTDGYYRLASGDMPFNSPEVHKAFALFTEMYAKNYMKSWSGYTWPSAADRLAQGKVAMYQMGDWVASYLKDKGMKPGIDFDFFPAPGLDGATVVQVDVMTHADTGDEAKNRAGKNFLLAAASAEGQRAFNAPKGSITANMAVDDSIYDTIGKKTWREVQQSNQQNKVLPNFKFLLPVELGEELGNQIAAYAQNPSPRALDTMLDTLEQQRKMLKEEGRFVKW
ncbi:MULTISPECIES: ABC transporter substrate-binding protein [unclassified Brenneria]|uniref:ABC transporter substrate-binding protein n=1 Tax=unclassified Brenneria TaxID=2634434 RepID=UPI001556D686|nr:extracellular solute-binding protein [Brenneria sp. hezel4-2-4]MEE3651918.1 extracellular solute-binding protein [Brenneria sp. HEZEL_4_2_4]NPD01878.1 extracellular solute-binding protein [Brenneria sp. hezel4-2-4]